METVLHLGAKLKKDFQKHLVFDAVFVSSILAEQLGASKPEINQLKNKKATSNIGTHEYILWKIGIELKKNDLNSYIKLNHKIK
ncbi:MAG: hypothetical protein NTV20_02205, partial [Candidatus Shapirobacteria bacterium]|nr:hypothetical protein [Candidatus Shapirobacteria bacterium]